jgi:hypothetical protein
MTEDRFLKRLRKKARKGLRGRPIATIAFYGPNLGQATKVVVGIIPSENAEAEELRDWKVDRGDVRADPAIAREILDFIENHRAPSVAMTIFGCPHQQGSDYEDEWCPICDFWHGRGRFTAPLSATSPDQRGSALLDFGNRWLGGAVFLALQGIGEYDFVPLT